MSATRILIVDDEPGMREVCADTLAVLDARIETAADGREAASRLEDDGYDLLVTDLRMPHVGGLELIALAREADPELPVVVITGHPEVDTAVAAMKHGAVDYLTKPFHPDELLATARQLLENRRLKQEVELLSRQVSRQGGEGAMLGRTPAMKHIFDVIEQVAPTDVDVLVTGETGTGKELAARALHDGSRRAGGRFVAVNAGAIPEQLLEAEFFGYERGAFTGAAGRSIGLMEYAGGGTLFLDEVAELPLPMQAKLLRALQERSVRRVGGRTEIPVDVRIVAATARDLEQAVAEGTFREDLYYRINVVHVEMPPLRRRREDIPLLVERFVARYAAEMGKPPPSVSPTALARLEAHPWPGNVRELQNGIRRAIALCRGGRLEVEDLPPRLREANGGAPPDAGSGAGTDPGPGLAAAAKGHGGGGLHAERDAFEARYLDAIMRAHGGDVPAATAAANLPRGSFYRLLKKHGLRAADYRP